MLCDTGPLVALVDRKQEYRATCKAIYAAGPLPLTTTWACMAEAMHILGRNGGSLFQAKLWQMWIEAHLQIHEHSSAEIGRMMALMAQYQNVPMDLADASIVAAAETLREDTLFTLDSDFRIYRLQDGSALKLLPE